MPIRILRTLAIVAVTTAVTIDGRQHAGGRPWPPTVHRNTGAAPVHTPAEALTTFSVPAGYRVELVAGEPLIQDPIFIDWDADGRLWAIELPGYMRDMTATGEYDPIGRIVVLTDTNRDGVMDERIVFADGLVQPRALKVLDRGVLVGEPPNVWLLGDADRNLRADSKTLEATNYGRRETNVEVNANGLLWALDNRIYVSGTGADMYLVWKNGKVETRKSLSRGQWGITQDDAGRIYRNHNESVLHADLVPTPYFARNPNLVRTRGSHEMLIDPDGDINAVWPARQTPGTNRAYQHGILREDGTLASFTAACAPTVYRGDRLPSELNGNVFVAEPAANLISRLIVYDDGALLRARKAYERTEFLTSTDERFRPVNLSSAPDGTLYVVDMYRGIIQHRAYITEYLREQILERKLEQPIAYGRIYRIVHETTKRDTRTRLSNAPLAGLVENLAHPNGWWRDTAQQLLVQRAGGTAAAKASVTSALVRLLTSAKDWRTRLHVLWTLDGIDAIDPDLVVKALEDTSPDVRVAGLRIAERWLSEMNHPIHTAVRRRQSDPDWGVRRQLAVSLGVLPIGPREAAIVALLERSGDDPIVLDAAISGLRGGEAAALERIISQSGSPTPQRDAAIAMLSATLVRSGQEAALQNMFAWAADSARPAWQGSALLRGAEIALLGAPAPGSPLPRRSASNSSAVPCPTCPGGRAGPGGAYAFPQAQAAAAAANASPSGRGARSMLRLNREPVALTGLAARGDETSSRAATLLARVTWPGKPGESSAVAPLSEAAQRRFEAGREIYRNICQACHQPDGRGQDRLAPTLIGSTLALASADVPVRILLNGKEGPVGLMPPIGSAFTDEQVAAVLTYVRREWGQDGTPVDPGTVAMVRQLTAGRTRPWTDQELLALAKAGR